MLRVLNVSKSGFYAWLKRLTSPRATQNAVLLEEIKSVHNASRGSYGSPRVTAELRFSSITASRGSDPSPSGAALRGKKRLQSSLKYQSPAEFEQRRAA